MHDCIGKIKQAIKQYDAHVIYSDGEGYVLYCIDAAPMLRWFVEVYEALGEAIPYTQESAVALTSDPELVDLLQDVHTERYKERQELLGKDWDND